jgi:hypothetical protein
MLRLGDWAGIDQHALQVRRMAIHSAAELVMNSLFNLLEK